MLLASVADQRSKQELVPEVNDVDDLAARETEAPSMDDITSADPNPSSTPVDVNRLLPSETSGSSRGDKVWRRGKRKGTRPGVTSRSGELTKFDKSLTPQITFLLIHHI